MDHDEILKWGEGKTELEIVIQGGVELEALIGDKAYEKFVDKINERIAKMPWPDELMGVFIRSESWVNPKPLSNRADYPKYRKLAGLEEPAAPARGPRYDRNTKTPSRLARKVHRACRLH